MYICTNDRYCATTEIFESVEDFLAMCEQVFSEAPVLLVTPYGVVIDPVRGETVLREVAV